MKRILLLIQSALVLFALSMLQSCIQGEPINAECDITGVDPTWVKEHSSILVGNPLVDQERCTVDFTIEKGTDRSALNPLFTLSDGVNLTADVDGAIITANGIMRDFRKPQTYTTHSQDGIWQKDYTVSFNYFTSLASMNFDHYKLNAKNQYYMWHEIAPKDDPTEADVNLNWWASGNGGFVLTGIAKNNPLAYPTAPFTDELQGPCVRLQTCRTGSFGAMVHMPIAAGSIFIGTFDADIAMKRPREATAFGLPILAKVPKSLEVNYRYKAGETFTDKDKNVCPERHDTADIYAVVYEIDPNHFEALNGDSVLTSKRIVMMARIDKPVENYDVWTHREEPFRYMNGHTAIDPERLALKGYAIAVVATSSRQGAYFEGAIGSVLDISHLKLVYE